jgi:hypothetical protein
MNMFKKMAIAAAVLCAVTAANAQMTFGARLGYSMQDLDLGATYVSTSAKYTTEASMGMLGLSVAGVANIPMGPVVIAPEVGFSYRTLTNVEQKYVLLPAGYSNPKVNITEFAITVPILVKWFSPVEGLYVAAGVQFDLPIGSELCMTDVKGREECDKMDGKTVTKTDPDDNDPTTNKHQHTNDKRAGLDFGIPLGIGYMVMPNLGVDFRYVLGMNTTFTHPEKLFGIPVDLESGKMSSFGLGVTYIF